MDEDEEEFYDSLDEDQNTDSESTDGKFHLRNGDKEVAFETSEITVYDDSEDFVKKEPSTNIFIPLYIGEIDKEDLKISKKASVNVASSHRVSKTCISCEASGKQKFKIDLSKKKQESSYWNIYCQKNGIPVNEGKNDTVRSLYGSPTSRTFSSFISNCCLSGNTWDAPSMFEKYMPKTYASQKNDLLSASYYDPDVEEIRSVTKCISTEIDVENLKSISQIDMDHAPPTQKISTSKILKSKSHSSNISLRPLTLKNTTPNPSKLELLKRQQEYGLKASSRNRARIIQNLTKLKQELDDSQAKKTVSRQ